MGIRLVKTCGACPEQYDAFLGEEFIGYLRLRHGYFRADYRGNGADDTVYESSPRGDGCFASEEERVIHLNNACRVLLQRHEEAKNQIPIYDVEEIINPFHGDQK